MDVTTFLALTLFATGATATVSQTAQINKPQLPILIEQIYHEEENKTSVIVPPPSYQLTLPTFVMQSYNNCGPAALSMIFSYYGKDVSQEKLADTMRPFHNPEGGNDDKSVFPQEFVATAESYGFAALSRPNGSVDLLKKLIANNIPVVVRTWLNPNEDIGHYRIIKGYDDVTQTFIQDDSYQGANLRYSYEEVRQMWQPFNYGYILVYPKDKQPIVDTILGKDTDRTIAWNNALKRAEQKSKENPDDIYAVFNQAIAYYHLGDYQKSVDLYEQVRAALPDRILWYELEPLYAYEKVGDYERVFEITDAIITHGNKAYSELYQIRGEIYLAKGDKIDAKNEFEKALYYNSNFQPAYNALAQVAM